MTPAYDFTTNVMVQLIRWALKQVTTSIGKVWSPVASQNVTFVALPCSVMCATSKAFCGVVLSVRRMSRLQGYDMR